jgi:hypothetical protein
MEVILSIVLFALLVFMGVYFYRKDRRYLNTSTKDSLGLEVRRELHEERKEGKKKQAAFLKAMDDAKKTNNSPND